MAKEKTSYEYKSTATGLDGNTHDITERKVKRSGYKGYGDSLNTEVYKKVKGKDGNVYKVKAKAGDFSRETRQEKKKQFIKESYKKAIEKTWRVAANTADEQMAGGDATHEYAEKAWKQTDVFTQNRRLKKIKATAKNVHEHVNPWGVKKRHIREAKQFQKKKQLQADKKLAKYDKKLNKYSKKLASNKLRTDPAKKLNKLQKQAHKKLVKGKRGRVYVRGRNFAVKVASAPFKAIGHAVRAVCQAAAASCIAFCGSLMPLFAPMLGILVVLIVIISATTIQAIPPAPTDLTLVETTMVQAMRDKGFGDAQIAGIIGNTFQESSNNSHAFDTSGPYGHPYYYSGGLFQWTNSGTSSTSITVHNFSDMSSWIMNKYQKPWDACLPGIDCDPDGTEAASMQMDYFLSGWDTVSFNASAGRYPKDAPQYASQTTSKEDFEATDDPALAAYIFMAGWERPLDGSTMVSKRMNYAKNIYEKLTSGGGSENRLKLVEVGKTQLGVPYVFGAYEPGVALDCSGFTKYCYSEIGVELPHSAKEQSKMATPKTIDTLQAGDLIFWIDNVPGSQSNSHVAMYIGNGQIIHSTTPKNCIQNLSEWSKQPTSMGSMIEDW